MRRIRVRARIGTWVAASLVVLTAGPAALSTEDSRKPGRSLDPIVVTAKRADDEVRKQVVTALHGNPYFYDGHVSVSIQDGVVTLSGMVFDEWDLRVAKRIAKRVPGVKRVVNGLEIKLGGE
jgi:osmotically-inducible protein OsmY